MSSQTMRRGFSKPACSLNFIALLAVSTMLAGCGTTGSGTDGSSLTKPSDPTYATADKDAVGKALAAPGDKVSTITRAVHSTFNDNDDTQKLDTVKQVQVTKTADGYNLKYGNAEVALTEKDYANGGYDSQFVRSNGQTRTLAFLSAWNGDTKTELSSSSAAMVPFRFGVRLKDDKAGGGNVGEANGFARGFAFAGLETDPSAVPKTGTATYKGGSVVEAVSKVQPSNATTTDYVRYEGDATLTANFDAGTVLGTSYVGSRQVKLTDGTSTSTNISGQNAAFQFNGKIEGNAFTIPQLDANDAAQAELASQGITNADVDGEGRFFGNDARSVGAILTGDSKDHVLTGMIYGSK